MFHKNIEIESCYHLSIKWTIKKNDNMNSEDDNLIGCLVSLYVIVGQIMAFIYFIQYCKTDSLFSIIFIDSLLSEFKGMLWIVFIWF
jgi:hypothetical protein